MTLAERIAVRKPVPRDDRPEWVKRAEERRLPAVDRTNR